MLFSNDLKKYANVQHLWLAAYQPLRNSATLHNFISYLRKLNPLTEGFYTTIIPMLKETRLESLLSVIRAGEICTTAYWIEIGYSRSFKKVKGKDELWKEVTIDFCRNQKIMLASEGFFNNDCCEYNIEIAKGSVIITFSRTCFALLKSISPEAEELSNKIMALEKPESLEKTQMMKMKPRERYIEFLRIFGKEIEQFFAAKHIASYLGMQPSYLSRLRAEMIRIR